MKQLNYPEFVAIDEFDRIAAENGEPELAKLNILRPRVSDFYDEYLDRFVTIDQLADNPFNNAESASLKSCYEISTSALEQIKKQIVTAQTIEFQLLCPYCLITDHSEWDHFLPKTPYPVYSVLTKNLIPCCSICNKKKFTFWRKDGRRAIIHFFNDDFFGERFFFCDLTQIDGIPKLKFNISFDLIPDEETVRIITNHFKRLNLLFRYQDRVTNLLSSIALDIASVKGFVQNAEHIAGIISEKARRLFANYGANYWVAAAYEVVAQSEETLLYLHDRA